MIVNPRRVFARPYFFEIFLAVNFVIIVLLAGNTSALKATPGGIFSSLSMVILCVVPGVLVRLLVNKWRGRLTEYLRVLRSPGWISDTVRILFFQGILTAVYSWIKLTVPLFHPRLMDAELWNLDRAMFFGYSPNVFFLHLFATPLFLRFIDLSYGAVFYFSSLFILAFVFSSASRRVRMAFMTASVLVWTIGAWLYLAVPSLGPAFRFPDVWFEYTRYLAGTQRLQLELLRNYTNLLQMRSGHFAPVGLFYGVAAFPSLHVAWLTLIAFWMRGQFRYSGFLFGIIVALMFIGSIITGWHYMIDSVAGLALGTVGYLAGTVGWRYARSQELCRALQQRGRKRIQVPE